MSGCLGPESRGATAARVGRGGALGCARQVGLDLKPGLEGRPAAAHLQSAPRAAAGAQLRARRRGARSAPPATARPHAWRAKTTLARRLSTECTRGQGAAGNMRKGSMHMLSVCVRLSGRRMRPMRRCGGWGECRSPSRCQRGARQQGWRRVGALGALGSKVARAGGQREPLTRPAGCASGAGQHEPRVGPV